MADFPTMLTPRELAAQSGMSEFAIRRMIRQNEIVYIRVGKKFLVNAEKFKEKLNGGDGS